MGSEQSSDIETVHATLLNKCRIIVVAHKNDDALIQLSNLPIDAKIVGIGLSLEELKLCGNDYKMANVLLRANVFVPNSALLEIIAAMPELCWIHSISAGVDKMLCPEIVNNERLVITNAKGIFSNSLAEFALLGCSYFAKNVPRLMAQKAEHKWEKFFVSELQGKKMGIVGYGDIGKSCAKLAKAYGMDVIGLKRNPADYIPDGYCDQMYGPADLNLLMNLSDYLVVCLALTSATHHFIKAENFEYAKNGLVLINVGRGLLIDEDAMIVALESGILAGAALDVFSVEPLPESSKLWSLPNVLISPHCNWYEDTRSNSVGLFVSNCIHFVEGHPLENIVDKHLGY